MSELSPLGNVPVDFAVLESLFADYKSVHNKICDLEKTGKIIRLKRGLYVVSPKETGKLLSVELMANHIYGPSYVSMESALRYYGLIPETVHTIRSITTKRSRDFNNAIGRFEYIECPASKRGHILPDGNTGKGIMRFDYLYSQSESEVP